MIPAPKVPTIIGTYMYLGGRYILKIAAAPAAVIPTYLTYIVGIHAATCVDNLYTVYLSRYMHLNISYRIIS